MSILTHNFLKYNNYFYLFTPFRIIVVLTELVNVRTVNRSVNVTEFFYLLTVNRIEIEVFKRLIDRLTKPN